MANVSPVFAGRTSELAALTAAFTQVRAGTPAAMLVGGEAGGGKTRLITEFIDRVGDEGLVLTGGCVEMMGTADLPYAPFTAILRQLVRRRGVDDVVALVPGGSGRDFARLLPEFGVAPDDRDTGTAQGRLFEQFLGLFENLAGKEPLVLVVEDTHWADRSTRDLIAFLARNLRDAAVLLIVTYRSDDLHRTHPLRPVLAELDRVPWVTRIDLRRLTRAEVAEQLTGILGQLPDASLVERAYARADGIPLFVEAMVDADGNVVEEIPESLRDLLLGRVHRLPDETQRVLLAASTSSSRVGHGLLGAVTGLDDAALAAAVRPAVTANVLVADADGYAYRHALIGEAVHEEFLPGEHTQTHRRFAEALEADPTLARRGAAELALHWHCAKDNPRALGAAWAAAAEFRRAFAYAERLAMLERVLELWDQVPDAAERIGAGLLDVLEATARAATGAGEPARGLGVVGTALAQVDADQDPERAARLLALRANLRKRHGQPGGLDDYRAAARLLPEPTAARARILTYLGGELILQGRIIEGRPIVEEAIDIARRVGDEYRETDALLSLGIALNQMGEIDAARAAFEEGRRRAERQGSERLLPRALLNLADFLEGLGQYERAAEAAREGITQARRFGRTRSEGVYAVVNLAEPQIQLGRLDEAAETLEQLDDGADLPVGLSNMVTRLRADIAVRTGADEAADRLLATLKADIAREEIVPQDALSCAELIIRGRLARDDVAGALAETAAALWGRRIPDGPRYVWPVLAVGMRACAADPDGAPRLRERLLELAAGLTVQTPVQEANRLLFAAESDRDPGAFDAAAAAWHDLDDPYLEAYALFRAAEALVVAGDRDAVADRLDRAAEIAGRLGATPLRTEIEDLARRGRISLAGARAETRTETPLGLTPRELEVLRLVAAGRSNRDIAAELFISAKTASVHVSNILAKLGVAGRGEAAATAHRLGLFD